MLFSRLPQTFDFSADASDPDADGMSDVEFYVGTNLVDDHFQQPIYHHRHESALGTYVFDRDCV